MARIHQNRASEPASSLDGLRTLGGLIGTLIVLGAAICGMERVRQHVFSQPEYNPAVRLELDGPPEWVEAEGWRPRILSAIKLPTTRPRLAEGVVQRVAAQFEASGWVAKVNRVRQGSDGVIRVSCEYRRPIAMIQTARGYVPVDHEGVRLPEVYQDVDESLGWMRIYGVESAAPEVGHPFQGDDAVAAVRLAALIFEQDFAKRITGIDVLNYRGRRDKHANHIKLRTSDGGKIDWGSAIGEEIEEPSAKDKIRNIALWFNRGSSQAQVDVSVYRNGWIEPAEHVVHTADGSAGRVR